MILHTKSDVSYLVQPNARCQFASLFCVSNEAKNNSKLKRNGPLSIICKTIQHAVASAAEAETHGLFFTAHKSLLIQKILIIMGHMQPPTSIKTNISTTLKLIQSNICQKQSKT